MVEKKMSFPSTRCADIVKSRSIDCKDLLGQLQRYERLESKITVVDDSESLSDIDDDELCRYLNSEEEVRCKKALWEEVNREQMKDRGTKRAPETKKAGPVKKASKVTVAADNENDKAANVKRRSLKINYDALERLEDELEIGNANKESTSSRGKKKLQLNVTLSTEGENSDDDEYGEDVTYGDENNGYGDKDYSDNENFNDEDWD